MILIVYVSSFWRNERFSRASNILVLASGCCSVVFEPITRISSASLMSFIVFVAPPVPKEVERPSTVGLCQRRAQWSMLLVLSPALASFAIRKFSSLVHLAEEISPILSVLSPSIIAAFNPAATLFNASSQEASLKVPSDCLINGVFKRLESLTKA